MRFDANIFTGEYPFRRLRPTRGDALLRLMDRLRIDKAVATAFPSIFYKDHFDGLRRTIAETEGCGDRVFHLAVLNPCVEGWREDLQRSLELPGVVGIRLYPRYHGYPLDGIGVNEMTHEAVRRGLVVCLAARLMDDRLHPRFLASAPVASRDVASFLEAHPRAKIILSQFLPAELQALTASLQKHAHVYVEAGCLGLTMTTLDNMSDIAPINRWIFGSGAPLFYATGTWMALENCGIEDGQRELVAWKNLMELLNISRGGPRPSA
ncbi:MAG: amidohydrolase family protein [Verrucomicrobia bacterium]|nr:amidohydrolase family protein [Verrucomicrobiota bacterium]